MAGRIRRTSMQLSECSSKREATISKASSAGDRVTVFRLVAFAAAVVAATLLSDFPWLDREADVRNAVGVIVSASATLLGFLVSAGALLYAVASTTLARNLQRTGHFSRLLEDLFV